MLNKCNSQKTVLISRILKDSQSLLQHSFEQAALACLLIPSELVIYIGINLYIFQVQDFKVH